MTEELNNVEDFFDTDEFDDENEDDISSFPESDLDENDELLFGDLEDEIPDYDNCD